MIEAISPRINFDNFFNSYLAINTIIINEDWHILLFDYIRSTSKHVWWFMSFIVITGEFILMKLFLALYINTYIDLLKNRNIKNENSMFVLSDGF